MRRLAAAARTADLPGIFEILQGLQDGGYLDGSQDLSWVRYKMEECCLTRDHVTCGEHDRCETIPSFINHPGYKYGKEK